MPPREASVLCHAPRSAFARSNLTTLVIDQSAPRVRPSVCGPAIGGLLIDQWSHARPPTFWLGAQPILRRTARRRFQSAADDFDPQPGQAGTLEKVTPTRGYSDRFFAMLRMFFKRIPIHGICQSRSGFD